MAILGLSGLLGHFDYFVSYRAFAPFWPFRHSFRNFGCFCNLSRHFGTVRLVLAIGHFGPLAQLDHFVPDFRPPWTFLVLLPFCHLDLARFRAFFGPLGLFAIVGLFSHF